MNDSTKKKNSIKNKRKDSNNNKNYSETSEQNIYESNANTSELTDITKSKTSIQNIITSPPIVRTKPKDKLNDLFGGGETIMNKNNSKTKKNIKVSKNKNNILSEKFDQVESFYDNMIKI